MALTLDQIPKIKESISTINMISQMYPELISDNMKIIKDIANDFSKDIEILEQNIQKKLECLRNEYLNKLLDELKITEEDLTEMYLQLSEGKLI